MRLGRSAGCLLLACVVGGCGRDTGQVSGKVTYKGQALTSGTVQFFAADGRVAHSVIDADGTYTVADAPVGLLKVTVASHPRVPPGLVRTWGKPPSSKAIKEATSYVPIPAKYEDPEESGLTCNVTGGRQTHHIDLPP